MPNNNNLQSTSTQKLPSKSVDESSKAKTAASEAGTSSAAGISSTTVGIAPPPPAGSPLSAAAPSSTPPTSAKLHTSEPASTSSERWRSEPTSGAESGITGAKAAVAQVLENGGQLLHDAKDKAADAAHTGLEYVERRGEELNRRLHGAVRTGQDYARRATRSSGQFVSVNALPLALIGAGLGWLVWSLRKQGRQSRAPARLERSYRPTREPLLDDSVDARLDLELSTSDLTYGRSVI